MNRISQPEPPREFQHEAGFPAWLAPPFLFFLAALVAWAATQGSSVASRWLIVNCVATLGFGVGGVIWLIQHRWGAPSTRLLNRASLVLTTALLGALWIWNRAPLPALTHDELRAFGMALADSVNRKDPSFLNDHFDFEGMLGKIWGRGAHGRMAPGTTPEQAIGHFTSSVKTGAWHYTFKKVTGDNKILIRASSGGSFNFHEYELARGEDGRVLWRDTYTYAEGSLLSESVSQLSVFKGPRSALIEKAFKEFCALSDKEAWPDILQAYEDLPRELKASPDVLVVRARAAFEAGGPAEAAAVRDLEQEVLPEHPGVGLTLIPYYRRQRSFDRILELLAGLSVLAPDASLESLRSMALVGKGDLPAARASAQKAIELEPDFKDGYYASLHVATHSGDHALTRELLEVLQKLDADVDALVREPDFAPFRASAEHEAWRAARQ